jgi:hypothetical protein
MAYNPKKLQCGETTSDTDTFDTDVKGIGLGGGLVVTVMTELAKMKASAIAEQKSFTSQSCGADCDKGKVTDPEPNPQWVSMVQKGQLWDLKFRVTWTASVECVKKRAALAHQDVKAKVDGADKVIAVIKYECIDGWIWVEICNATGNVVLSRERTAQKCPLTGDQTVDEYGYDLECINHHWWITLKDPKTGDPVSKKKTDASCGEKEEKPPDKPKDK